MYGSIVVSDTPGSIQQGTNTAWYAVGPLKDQRK